MRSSHPPFQSRVVRLLVFACFFNFSGVNNGYTTLTAVAPLNASQSVSIMGTCIKSFAFFLSPQKAFSSFNRGRRWANSLNLSTEKSMKPSMRRGEQRLRSARVRVSARGRIHSRSARSMRSTRSARFTRSERVLRADLKNYLKEKETWNKQKEAWSKENWNGLCFHPAKALPSKDLNAPRMTVALLAPEPVWDEGRRLQKVLRHLAYPDGGDALIAGAVRPIHNIPGPLYDRGLFLGGNA